MEGVVMTLEVGGLVKGTFSVQRTTGPSCHLAC